MQTSRENNSRILRIKNAKFFQIYISVPLMILLNYTNFCVLSFGNLLFLFIFVFDGKITSSTSTFTTLIFNFCAFSLKKWFLLAASITSVLSYSQIVNFLLIFWWTLKQVVSNSQLYLIFIATYDKHLFTIKLKIHICHFPPATHILIIHLFCFDIK